MGLREPEGLVPLKGTCKTTIVDNTIDTDEGPYRTGKIVDYTLTLQETVSLPPG